MIIFSGDIGGTHTRMQLTEFTNSREMKVIASFHYNNKDYTHFPDVIDAFCRDAKIKKDVITSACFGIAGPIIEGSVKVTNLPWMISVKDIKKKLKIDKVELINDFTAIGYGLEGLKSESLLTLQTGKPHKASIKAYIGAGTGLGAGFMSYHQGEYLIHATEGGHIDFAPTDATQLELLKHLRKKYQRVSLERVLSGPGLINIYCFVRDNKILGEEENQDLRFLIEKEKEADIAAAITEYAIKHKDLMAMRALEILIKIYGAAAGNLALTTLPLGGLYVVGGIAQKILKQIKRGSFLEAFSDKGRMSGLLKDIPLYVVLDEDVGLKGATALARKIATTN